MGNANSVFLKSIVNADIVSFYSYLQKDSDLLLCNLKDPNGNFGLHLLCSRFTSNEQVNRVVVEMIQQYVKKYNCINVKNEVGKTGIHLACCFGNFSILKCLYTLEQLQVVRDEIGFLPQDYILYQVAECTRDEAVAWQAKLNVLYRKHNQDGFFISAFGLRASTGVVELRVGDGLQLGSFITVQYHVPESHEMHRDYIQMVTFEDALPNSVGVYGQRIQVPTGKKNGEVVFPTMDMVQGSICRFLYVKTDKNGMNLKVMASGGAACLLEFVDESMVFDLYVYNKVLEIENSPDLMFDPLEANISIKRIGILVHKNAQDENSSSLTGTIENGDAEDHCNETILEASSDETVVEWVKLNKGNYIVQVNDMPTVGKDLQQVIDLVGTETSNGYTKLQMQNPLIKGDFIAEKVLGKGIIGKFAQLVPYENLYRNSTCVVDRNSSTTMSIEVVGSPLPTKNIPVSPSNVNDGLAISITKEIPICNRRSSSSQSSWSESEFSDALAMPT